MHCAQKILTMRHSSLCRERERERAATRPAPCSYSCDIFSAHALCIDTFGEFYNLSGGKALGVFVAFAMYVKENIRATCIPGRGFNVWLNVCMGAV